MFCCLYVIIIIFCYHDPYFLKFYYSAILSLSLYIYISVLLVQQGSPEQVMSLCRPESIPKDANFRLAQLAQRGLHVMALAARSLPKISVAEVWSFKKETATEIKRG